VTICGLTPFLRLSIARGIFAIVSFFAVVVTNSAQQLQWSLQDSPTEVFLESVFFVDSLYGWSVGGNLPPENVIIHTTDSGASWSLQPCPTELTLRSCHFVDRMSGWAVGGNAFTDATAQGIIIHTTDGGQSWFVQVTDSQYCFNSVHFVDDTHGWVVGEDYLEGMGLHSHTIVLRSTDGGYTWERRDLSSLGRGLKGVFFVDRLNGWAVGQYGTVLHTTDGGSSWVAQDSGTPPTWLYSICSVDRNTAWIAGDCFMCDSIRGVVLKTTNSGTSWIAQDIRAAFGYRSIHFVDRNNGWVASARPGNIVHTSNGGQNWNTQPLPVHDWLNSVFFTDLQHGWTVGDSGVILHFGIPMKRYDSLQLSIRCNNYGNLSSGDPYLFTCTVKANGIRVPSATVRIEDPILGDTSITTSENGECIYHGFVQDTTSLEPKTFTFTATKSGYLDSQTKTQTLSVTEPPRAGSDETDAMGVCPTAIITGNGHNVLDFSKEGKLVAYYTTTVGSWNVVPYTTSTSVDNFKMPLYGAPEHEGMFAGVEIDGMFVWLWQIPNPEISHPDPNSQQIQFQYRIPFEIGGIQVTFNCIAGHPEQNRNASLQSYEIINTTGIDRRIQFVYYGFVHPTTKNQAPPLRDPIPNLVVGWQYQNPFLTRATLDAQQILVKPGTGYDGQYISVGATLETSGDLLPTSRTKFGSLGLLSNAGVFASQGVDFSSSNTYAEDVRVNWALEYGLGILSSSPANNSRTINVFIATGSSEEEAKDGLSNAKSNGCYSFLDNAKKWMQSQNFLSVIDGLSKLSLDEIKLLKRWAITCRMLVDTDSGAIIASPNRQPKYYSTWVRDGVFQALFWELLGEKSLVNKFFDFLIHISESYKDKLVGESRIYWRQCYSILPDPADRYQGLPFFNGVEPLRPGVVEEDQMGEFLWALYIIARNRRGQVPGTVSPLHIQQIADYIKSRINNSSENGKIGLLLSSFDWYEFPQYNGYLDDLARAFLDASRAAIGQSMITNSSGVAGLNAAFCLTGNTAYQEKAVEIQNSMNTYFIDNSNPSEPTIEPPSYVLLGNVDFSRSPFTISITLFNKSTRDELYPVSFGSVWPLETFTPSTPGFDKYRRKVFDVLSSLKNPGHACFTPLYLLFGLYEQYLTMPDNSIINEIRDYLVGQSVQYVPEKFFVNGRTMVGLGATPLGWSNAWAGLALLAKAGVKFNDLVITGIKEEKKSTIVPNKFSLFQNYPNPFNPSTTIEFSLPRSSYVTLKVFNLLGQEVATLTGQNFTAGSYSVEWNAKGVASGVYLYRLVAGSFVDTKKMLLLK
jgi:photosystem II stability/assembly factor-like uncharacterized protein